MEKHRAIQRQIHSAVINQDEITDQDKKISRYFLFINLYYRVKFSFKQTCFWDEVKKPLLASIHKTFLNQELSTSQKQAVMKMLEKKDKDKRFIKNWRPMSLLNTDMKIISKVLST